MKGDIFWGITPFIPFKVNICFAGIYRLHLQDRKISGANNHRESRWQALIINPEVGGDMFFRNFS
jgi:hypothetical protein